jgi:hypothetical protein
MSGQVGVLSGQGAAQPMSREGVVRRDYGKVQQTFLTGSVGRVLFNLLSRSLYSIYINLLLTYIRKCIFLILKNCMLLKLHKK